jgi:hypothetical protein
MSHAALDLDEVAEIAVGILPELPDPAVEAQLSKWVAVEGVGSPSTA